MTNPSLCNWGDNAFIRYTNNMYRSPFILHPYIHEWCTWLSAWSSIEAVKILMHATKSRSSLRETNVDKEEVSAYIYIYITKDLDVTCLCFYFVLCRTFVCLCVCFTNLCCWALDGKFWDLCQCPSRGVCVCVCVCSRACVYIKRESDRDENPEWSGCGLTDVQ